MTARIACGGDARDAGAPPRDGRQRLSSNALPTTTTLELSIATVPGPTALASIPAVVTAAAATVPAPPISLVRVPVVSSTLPPQ